MRRGISRDTIKQFSIRFDSKGNKIVIPVYTKDGIFLFNKYRRDPLEDETATSPKYTYDRGGKVTLFGLQQFSSLTKAKQKTVVITEGELDCLVLWSSNIPAVSSTGGAMSFQKEWILDLAGTQLDKQDENQAIPQVYVCFDNDDAGADGMVRVLSYIPNAKIVFIPELPDVKDISDFVARGGNFRALMDTAVSFTSKEDVQEDMKKRSAAWLPTRFHRAYLKFHEEQRNSYNTDPLNPRKTSDKVMKAKDFPLTSLIKFDKQGNAICPFHSEDTPSFHYYKKTNSAYCFGACGRAYDSIDVYREQQSCTFKEALNDLIADSRNPHFHSTRSVNTKENNT